MAGSSGLGGINFRMKLIWGDSKHLLLRCCSNPYLPDLAQDFSLSVWSRCPEPGTPTRHFGETMYVLSLPRTSPKPYVPLFGSEGPQVGVTSGLQQRTNFAATWLQVICTNYTYSLLKPVTTSAQQQTAATRTSQTKRNTQQCRAMPNASTVASIDQ